MLSEKHLELLTAYVDGELTIRQRRHVEQLVQQSPAARHILQQLQSDSRQLTALPRKEPPRDLPRQVLRETAAVALPVPATPSTLVPAAVSGVPTWVGVLVAASVLVLITAASYWFFSIISGPRDQQPIVEKGPSAPEAPNKKPDGEPESPKNEDPEDGTNQNKKEKPKQEEPVQQPLSPFFHALTDLPGRLVVEGFHRLHKAPHLYALSDIPTRPDLSKRLTADLYRTAAVEFDVFTTNPSNAAGDLEKVLAKKDVKVLMDKKTRNRIKKGDKARYLLFVEDLPATHVAGILQEFGKQHKLSTPSASIAVLRPITTTRRGQLAELLELPANQMNPAQQTSKKVDLSPEDTPGQVVVTDPKKGTSDQTGSQKNQQPPPPPHFALLVTVDAAGSMQRPAAEVKQFRNARKASRPNNTLQLVIVLHAQ
jgi:hypothetical protein